MNTRIRNNAKVMPKPDREALPNLIGEHPSLYALRDLAARVAASKARNILIYGETGSGKGLVARLIHQLSHRAHAPFLDINCAAIPDSLLESELFGYEKGAFTGANSNKQGLIEAATEGTFFLDEVPELNPTMQAKMLTLLDTQRFRRVGSVKPTSVNVRFIAATNKILLDEVKAGRFREDLYYRLQVVAINLPPLRERGDDIFILAKNFMSRFNQIYGSRIQFLDPSTQEVFLAYPWPGNVRELENLIERICILEDGDTIKLSHLPARIIRQVNQARNGSGLSHPASARHPEPVAATNPMRHAAKGVAPGIAEYEMGYHTSTANFQRSMIISIVNKTNGNLNHAAIELKMSRHALRHQMIKLGLARYIGQK